MAEQASIELLNDADLMALFKVGRTKLWELKCSDGFPRPVKLGGRVKRYFAAEVRAWLESQKT